MPKTNPKRQPAKAAKMDSSFRRDDPEQSEAFIQKAKEIEADEKRSVADSILGRLAEMSPKPHVDKKTKPTD